jgi:TRAP-type mannitol/chloroaromatic compound transport system substrate-binding protein
MRRRDFITGIGGVGAGLAAASTLPKPAIAQGTRELRMVSTFVKNFPGLGTSANRLVERIRIASDGKLRIRLYNANELVAPLEVFDVVSKGDAFAGVWEYATASDIGKG